MRPGEPSRHVDSAGELGRIDLANHVRELSPREPLGVAALSPAMGCLLVLGDEPLAMVLMGCRGPVDGDARNPRDLRVQKPRQGASGGFYPSFLTEEQHTWPERARLPWDDCVPQPTMPGNRSPPARAARKLS
jgi:hypothetical protein